MTHLVVKAVSMYSTYQVYIHVRVCTDKSMKCIPGVPGYETSRFQGVWDDKYSSLIIIYIQSPSSFPLQFHVSAQNISTKPPPQVFPLFQ